MATKIYQCMQKISDAIVENKDFLTDLDREIGDADHGVNMARGFTEVMKQLPEDEEDYGVVLKKVGMVLLSKVGGASGPLYGTAYMKAGAAVKGKTSITLEDAKAMLTEVIGGIKMRGKAVKGEKTMLDALEPALDALTKGIENGDDAETCLNAMCEAAREGVEFTKTIRATKGRASYLGDRSIGHQDPGATSATITLEAIRDFYLENKQSKQGIEQANGGEGVVLLADLGSGILSSQMAIDLLEEDIPVQIADAPILEGAISAAVQAAIGGNLKEVIEAAELAKQVSKLE